MMTFRRFLVPGMLLLFAAAWVFALWARWPLLEVTHRIGFEGDAFQYSKPAVWLVTNGIYSLDGVTPFFEREPGYAMLLSLIYRVFGLENYMAVYIIQTLLYLTALLFFVGTIRRIVSERTAMITLGILLFLPSIFVISLSLLREMWALTLLLLFTSFFLRLSQDRRWTHAVGAGLAMGWLILSYSPFLVFPFFMLAAFWFYRIRWTHAVLMLILIAAVVAPWGMRNYGHKGMLCLTGCYREALQWYVRGEQAEQLRGLEPLKCLHAEYITRNWEGRSPVCSFNGTWHLKWPQGFKGVPEDQAITKSGQQKILDNFGWYVWGSLFEILEFHIPYVNHWGSAYNNAVSLVMFLVYMGILFAVKAVWRRELVLFGLIAGYIVGVFMFTDATPRYQMPVIFCYALLAGIGYDRCLSWLSNARGKHRHTGL
jgi:4-amino-4-deoxy-L-arabinose transferase-like glycosyltransferase